MVVSVEEAQSNLRKLVREAVAGEEIIIELEENVTVRIVATTQPEQPRERPGYGSAKGWFTVSDDFDEPLEDLEKAIYDD